MSTIRKLGPWSVPAVGLGCMNLSHAYGAPLSAEAGRALLERALDLGVKHFDTAALYGFGRNEKLVGPFLKRHRQNIVMVSKCGMRGEQGVRTIDSSPAALRKDIEHSLRRLETDVIDLYYLHRHDRITPIEDSVGEMSRLVDEGKIRAIGLSEVSAESIQRAHAVHQISAVQSEYSPWSRNVEIGVLDACQTLGVAFVAFSPVGRGFLTSVDLVPEKFVEDDIRRGMPRFQQPHFARNLEWLSGFRKIADDVGCTAAQLSIAWVLSRHDFIHAIPGTTSVVHLQENLTALGIELSDDIVTRINALVTRDSVSGDRYPAQLQREIDTEEFA